MDALQDFFLFLYQIEEIADSKLGFDGVQIRKLFECTSKGNKARTLCVAVTAISLGGLGYYYNRRISELVDATNSQPDFFKDILAFEVDKRGRMDNGMNPLYRFGGQTMGSCLFHNHAEGTVCHLEAHGREGTPSRH
jgi:hypothetical protein